MADYASWELDEGEALVAGRTVLKGLGGGSRYEVFLVWDEHLFSLAVAKVLRPDRVEDERALRELGEEAELLERLAHPVVVRGFDAVLEGSRPHVLIEHLEGPSLRRLIRQGGPLPMQQLLPLALHVAGAVQYLANSEVVHLDVKPDNIVMGVPPRLIDLSVARTFARAARTKGAIGTDAYMAPEQCGTGVPGAITAATDVWGLGATLFHAVSGSVPFLREEGARESEDPAVRFPQLHRDPEPLPRGLPDEVHGVIVDSLAKDPDARPTASEVTERLEPLVAALPRRIRLGRRR